MKSYNHLYEKTISETNRRYALSQAKHSKRFRKIMKHPHMSDDALEQSLDWIVNYENAEHVPVYIYDGITRKERTIIVPTMEELLVQHCIVNAMKPMFCNGMYEHSYASLPGRGAHKGKQIIEKWRSFSGLPQELNLPSAPKHFIQYLEEDNRPQAALDVNYENGFGVSFGRLREDTVYDWKFVGLSHNTVRGAAGGAVLCAELLKAQGYITKK